MTLTPGNVVDYKIVRARINELASLYSIQSLALDRLWQGQALMTQLYEEDGINVVPFGQGFLSMSIPSKQFEVLVKSRQIIHDGNPVMDWMISHCQISTDPAGNMKPVKPIGTGADRHKKVDGVVASVMAMGRCLASPIDSNVATGPLIMTF